MLCLIPDQIALVFFLPDGTPHGVDIIRHNILYGDGIVALVVIVWRYLNLSQWLILLFCLFCFLCRIIVIRWFFFLYLFDVLRHLIHKVRLFFQLIIYHIFVVLFNQRNFTRKQIGSKTQMVSLDRNAKCCQRCRELIKGRIFPVFRGVGRLHWRIDIRHKDFSLIRIRHILAEITVHRQMISGNYDRCILIEILALHPLHKLCHASA